MYVLNRTSKKAISSFVFAFTFNAFLLHWTSTFVGSIPWIILVLGLSLMYVPLSLIKRWGVSAYPLIFIILEEVRNRFPFGGFGWARIAYSQADAPFSKIASIGGATALSATAVVVGFVIYSAFNKKFRILALVPLFALLMNTTPTTIGSSNVLLVQGNVPSYGLDFNSRATQVFYNHVKETRKALKENDSVDFIVWPENAVDVDPFTNSRVQNSLNTFEVPIILGAIVDKGRSLLNTSILWTKESRNVYIKQHLTPFGEYIPLRSIAEIVSPYTDQVRDFTAGTRGKIFTIDNSKIAPIICYELLDDQILGQASKGSNLLVVQTNSATFGRSAESAQQLSMTRIRAIEHQRNILSVSTTGYSAVIDFEGNVSQQSSMGNAEHIFATVDLVDSQSPRDRYGDWSIVFTFVWLMILVRRARI